MSGLPSYGAPIYGSRHYRATTPWPGTLSRYPVDVTFDESIEIARLWGLPLIGVLVRALAVVPHFIGIWLLSWVLAFLVFIAWLPVLVMGSQAEWIRSIVRNYETLYVRTIAWVGLTAGAYPLLEDVEVRIDEDQPVNRFWGIPLLGMTIRSLVLIPHYVVLWALMLLAGIVVLFSWLPVLLYGRQAAVVYQLVGGWLRYQVRVDAYFWLLTDRYPPFRLAS